MTDERFERLLADVLAEVAPVSEPSSLFPDTLRAARRATPRPRWLALMKEPPMRRSTRVAVGSPAARMSYLALLLALTAVLVVGAVVAAATLLPRPSPGPDGPRLIVVDPSGGGDVTTIAKGVSLAVDGDTVLVRPGIYREWILIDAAITLTGDGPRETVIVEVDPDGPLAEAFSGFESPYGIQLRDTSAVVSHLTVRGADSGIGIKVSGGDATLEDLAIEMGGTWSGTPLTAFVFADGAAGTLRDVTGVPTSHVMAGAHPRIDRLDVPHMFINGLDAAPTITDSDVDWADITEGANPTITGSRLVGVAIESAGATLRDNFFGNPGYEIGDRTEMNGDGTAAAIGITSSSPVIEGNRIGDMPFGIKVSGGAPTLTGNTIEHNAVGLQVVYDSGMTLTGNTFCGNGEDLQASPNAGLSIEGQTCPEPGASAAAGSEIGTAALLASLQTVEVEPGVRRVDADGARTLRWQPPDPAERNPWCCYVRNEMAFSIDGTPWFFPPEGFFGLGLGVSYPWPEALLPWDWLWTGALDVTVGPTDRPEAILLRVSGRAWRAAVASGVVTWEQVDAAAAPSADPAGGDVNLDPTVDDSAVATNGAISWSHQVVPDASGDTAPESPERWTRSQDGVRIDFEAPEELPRISRAHDGGGRFRVGLDGALWFTPRNEAAGPYTVTAWPGSMASS